MVSLLSQADWAHETPGLCANISTVQGQQTFLKRNAWFRAISRRFCRVMPNTNTEPTSYKLGVRSVRMIKSHVLIVHGNVQVIDCCRRGTCCGWPLWGLGLSWCANRYIPLASYSRSIQPVLLPHPPTTLAGLSLHCCCLHYTTQCHNLNLIQCHRTWISLNLIPMGRKGSRVRVQSMPRYATEFRVQTDAEELVPGNKNHDATKKAYTTWTTDHSHAELEAPGLCHFSNPQCQKGDGLRSDPCLEEPFKTS